MEGIKPCPYCGGEVEVIRLANDKKDGHKVYRIECRRCRALVVKGQGFADETKEEAAERIAQYEAVLNEKKRGILFTHGKKDPNGKRKPFWGYDNQREV